MESKTLKSIANAAITTLSLFSPLVTWAAQPASVTWEAFWIKVSSQNPRVQSLKARTEASRSQVELELPPPVVGFSTMGENSPTTGVMERSFEVSQRIPFPTKFVKASGVKEARVQMQSADESAELQKIRIAASALFIDLHQNLKSQSLFSENRQILERHLKRLQSLLLSDQLQKVHILEISSEVKAIDSEIKDLEFKEKDIRRQIGDLLNEEEAFSGSPVLSALEAPRALKLPKTLVSTESAKKREDLALTEQSFAKQAWLPDLTLTYRRRNRLDGVMPSSHEVMIGVEIPFLWGWQPSARNQVARAQATEARFDSLEAQRRSTSEIKTLGERASTDWERIKLYRDEILPIQEKRVALLHRIIPSDMESLDLHRTTLEKWLSARIKALEIESDYRRASAALEVLAESAPEAQ